MQIFGVDLASGKDRLALSILDKDGKLQMVVDRDELNRKDAARKADREFIARAILAIVERHGAAVEKHDEPATVGYCGAGIALRFRLNGVGAMIDLDNLHGGGWSLISWHNAGDGPVRDFSARFCRVVCDLPPRKRLHHKATSQPADWYSLAMMLDAGLCLAARGEAFEAAFDL